MTREIESPYECVDLQLGEYVLMLDSPDLDPDLRRQVGNHLEVCDHCRWQRAAETRLADDLRQGRVELPPVTRRRGRSPRIFGGPGLDTVVGWAGGTLAAACLALLVLLPPRADFRMGTTRDGGEVPHFLRPVEDEIVASPRLRLRWTPIERAVGYEITVQQLDGDYRWRGECEATEIAVPADRELPRPGRFRAILRPVPADTAPSQDVSVVFETGSTVAAARFRLGASPAWLRWIGFGGVVLMLVPALARRKRRTAG